MTDLMVHDHHSTDRELIVHDVAHHRNGVAGAPFYVVSFTDPTVGAMVATVFDGPGEVAVLALGILAEGNIRFGENSWRGDTYEPALRSAIAAVFG